MKDKLLELAEDIENAPLGECGPSDDPDMQYAYTCGFRDIAIKFISGINRLGESELCDLVCDLNTNISNDIRDAHKLKADLIPAVELLRDFLEDPDYKIKALGNRSFLNLKLLEELKGIQSNEFDLSKLIRMCEDLNECYGRGNYISALLLLRAIINHVPPIFGKVSFDQVVASSGRSIKMILKILEDEARPIADLHTHILIRKKESCPTRNQVDPYKSCFEVLINEIISNLHGK